MAVGAPRSTACTGSVRASVSQLSSTSRRSRWRGSSERADLVPAVLLVALGGILRVGSGQRQDAFQQALLPAEGDVDRVGRHAGGLRHRGDRGAGVAMGKKQVSGGGQDPSAGSVGLLRAQRRMVPTPPVDITGHDEQPTIDRFILVILGWISEEVHDAQPRRSGVRRARCRRGGLPRPRRRLRRMVRAPVRAAGAGRVPGAPTDPAGLRPQPGAIRAGQHRRPRPPVR